MRRFALLALFAACSGPPAATAPPAQAFVGPAPLRRLSNLEYLNALSDLFPAQHPQLPPLPMDTLVAGFENDAEAQAPSDVRIARFEQIARLYAEGSSEGADLAVLGQRLFRRPLTADELQRWNDRLLRWGGDDSAKRQVLFAMLQSPQFLYRVESSPPTAYDVASRLSFFLWESVPDDTLLAAAAAGHLSTAAQVRAQAERMLDDPRALRSRWSFHRQWLGLDRILGEEHAVRTADPLWSAASQQSALADTRAFVEQADGVGGLLTGTASGTDAETARLYDSGSRPGVLTRIAWLAGNSHRGATSPPMRGNALQSRLLCLPPVSPPPGADLSAPSASEGVTNRQRFEARTAPASCQACHASLNGLGFGFEHFAANGAWQDTDEGAPVDAHGVVLGTDVDGPFDGADALVQRLAQSRDVRRCSAQRWLQYALGRPTVDGEAPLIEALTVTRATREVLLGIVTSPTFRLAGAPE